MGCVINMTERVGHNELLSKHICAREYVGQMLKWELEINKYSMLIYDSTRIYIGKNTDNK